MNNEHGSLLLILTLMFGVATGAGQDQKSLRVEQRDFSMEQEIIAKPVDLPENALRSLTNDEDVSSCLADRNLPPTQPPRMWFAGSEIHLAGPDESDLIVLPAFLKALEPMHPPPNSCFIGAYTSRFWVLRTSGKDYELVLAVDAHDLRVLRTKWRGYAEIETSISTLHGRTTRIYRFDGKSYKLYKESNDSISEFLNLSQLKTPSVDG